MIKRIGHVVGWFGNVLGGLFVVYGVTHYYQLFEQIMGKLSGHEYLYDPVIVAELNFLMQNNVDNVKDLRGDMLAKYHVVESVAREAEIQKLLAFIATGLVIFLVGRALRYVLAGKVAG